MKINNYTEYSFRVLIYLIKYREEKTQIQNIAEYFSISINHLNKVVQNLAKLGLILSTRGKNGGIEITTKGENIHVNELILLIEPEEEVAQCMGSKNLLPCRLASDCKLRGIFHNAKQAFYKELQQYQIKDLV